MGRSHLRFYRLFVQVDRMGRRYGVNRYEWAFSFPEPDWWGTIFRDVGAQSVGKRSEVSEILRPFSSAA